MAPVTTRATEAATLTVAAINSSTALLKVTVAAVASSAISWVVTTSRAVAVAMVTRQAAVPAVPTLVLHHRTPTNQLVRHPRAMAPTLAPLIRAQGRRTMARSLVPHHRKIMARNTVPHRRASVLSPGRTTRRVATTDSSHTAASNQVASEVSRKQAPTVARHLSTAATVKAVTTSSLRADTHKADTAVRLLLQAGTAAVDMSSSMATAVMGGDLESHGLDFGHRQTGMVFCKKVA